MNPSFSKQLTDNDLGLTGGHQGGICVPRSDDALLAFLPRLDTTKENPSTWIDCIDQDGVTWKMRYVYYNGKLTGRSTRNEYRITYMTKFFRRWKPSRGSSLVITGTGEPDAYRVHIEKPRKEDGGNNSNKKSDIIILKNWRKIH